MKDFEQIKKRIENIRNERSTQRKVLDEEIVAAQLELSRLVEEQNEAKAACDVETFTFANSAALIAEAKLNILKQKMEDFDSFPIITADEFEKLKNELKNLANAQILSKYKLIDKYIEKIGDLLNEVEHISETCYDTYLEVETLTRLYSNTKNDDCDINGNMYHRKMSYYKIPHVLVTQLTTCGNSAVKGIISNIIEIGQVI